MPQTALCFEDNVDGFDVDAGIFGPVTGDNVYSEAYQLKVTSAASVDGKIAEDYERQILNAPAVQKIFQVMIRDSTGNDADDIARIRTTTFEDAVTAATGQGVTIIVTDFLGKELIREAP